LIVVLILKLNYVQVMKCWLDLWVFKHFLLVFSESSDFVYFSDEFSLLIF